MLGREFSHDDGKFPCIAFLLAGGCSVISSAHLEALEGRILYHSGTSINIIDISIRETYYPIRLASTLRVFSMYCRSMNTDPS